MARTVSVPTNALRVAYAGFACEDDEDAPYLFDAAVDDFQYTAKERYPSLKFCDKWLAREDRAVLENKLVYVTVSEYCGLVAVAVVPKYDDTAALAQRFADQIDLNNLAGCFGPALRKIGSFSNGEALFRAVAA
jgi:hypothetical protein